MAGGRRHPGYFGFFLTLPEMAFALAILALVPLLDAWLVERFRHKEAMLLAEFGDAYRRYPQRTKRLIPFLY